MPSPKPVLATWLLSALCLPYAAAQCNAFTENVLYQNHQSVEELRRCTYSGSRAAEGCQVMLNCREDYYFKDYPNGIRLTCSGGSWTLENRAISIPQCLPGCLVLGTDDLFGLRNATLVGTAPRKQYPGADGKAYWPAGEHIRTKCKDGYDFEEPYWRKAGTDDYTCIGGNDFWQNEHVKDYDGSRPALCKPNCEQITPIPPSVEVVIQPGKDDMTDSGRVFAQGIYKFRCKKGESMDCRKEQMLICRGGVDGYYDSYNGKTRQTVFNCAGSTCPPFRNNDPNAQEVVMKDSICTQNEDREVSEGCEIKLRCKENYYYDNAKDGDGRVLLCKEGQWIDKNTGKEPDSSSDQCQKGCKVLRDDDPQGMKNATFIGKGKPTKTFKNGKAEYWPAGTFVETKCKDGFAFDEPENRKRQKDGYECIGGNDYWNDDYQKKYTGGRPGLCPPTCEALTKLPPGVVITADPKDADLTEEAGGKTYVFSFAMYKFKCANGYKYPDGATTQTLICRGGDLQYQDMSTKQMRSPVKECISDGCTAITEKNIDKNAFIADRKNCGSTLSQVASDNCTVTIRCNGKSHFFHSPDYPDGQKLTCKEGNWVDQYDKVVKPNDGIFSDNCDSGCPAIKDTSNITFVKDPPSGDTLVKKNGNDEIWLDKVVIETECKTGFGRPNHDDQKHDGPISYTCSADNGWVNNLNNAPNQDPGKCELLCKVPTATTGTQVTVSPSSYATTSHKLPHVYQKGKVIIKCEAGFEPPEGVKYPGDTQELICKGGNDGLSDVTTGKDNAAPMVCKKEGAKGCPPITQPSDQSATVVAKDCNVQDGVVPPSCKVSIKCNSGFYAVDSKSGKPTREQSLTCVAGDSGWVDDKDKTKNSTQIICIPGCEVIDNDRIEVVGKPSKNTVDTSGKKFYPKGTTIKVKCKKDYVPRTPLERDEDDITYVCDGGNPEKQWINNVTGKHEPKLGGTCSKTCIALDDLPNSMVPTQTAGYTVINGKKVVVEGERYAFKCANGFKYPADSSSAKTGTQRLECVGDPDGYRDMATNKTVKKPVLCDRGSPEGCTALDVKNPPPNTKVVDSGGCELKNGLTPPGCKVSLECANEYYPKDKVTQEVGKQDLECQDNGTQSQWTDRETNKVIEFLECEPGCSVPYPLQNAEYVVQPASDAKSGNKNFFKPGTTVTVKCKPGTLPKEGDPDDAGKPMEYECKGGEKGWLNKKTGKNEKKPGDTCQALCPALTQLPVGVRGIAKPSEEYLDGRWVVRDGGKYVLQCQTGYHYPNDTVESKKNRQEAECDGVTGQYIDPSNGGNKTFLQPLECLREVGDGCMDLPQVNADVDGGEKCPKSSSVHGVDCVVTFKCKEGFYPSAPNYQKNGKQTLTCKDGKDWVDQNGKIITGPMDCLPGCLITEDDKKTVKVTTDSGSTVKVDKFVFYKPGAVVKVTCQGDGVVWKNDVGETNKEHEFNCTGGPGKWDRNDDRKKTVTIGEGCVGTCKKPTLTLPDTVLPKKQPGTFEYEGEVLVFDGEAFTFGCQKDYVYPKNSPHAPAGKQELRCNGEKREMEDKDNAANKNATVQACEPKDGANLCKEIKQNSDVHASTKDCQKKSSYYNSGCRLELSCKKGFYPKNPAYQRVPGSQRLTCQGSGRGWVDQSLKPVTEPLECVEGCVKADSNSDTHTNTETETIVTIVNGEQVTCTKKKVQVIKNVTVPNDNAFYCPEDGSGTSNNETDKTCQNACAAPKAPFPEGVTVDSAPPYLVDGKYMANKQQYIFKCKDGFRYPKDSKHRPKGKQVLECDGKTSQLKDLYTGQQPPTIEACEEVKGCSEIKQLPNSNTETISCSAFDGTVSAGCKLSVSCKPGFYPKDPKYLVPGKQQLTCSTDGSGWKDQNGTKVEKPLDCVEGCIDGAVLVEHTVTNNDTKNCDFLFIRDKQKNIIAECVSEEDIKRLIEEKKFKLANDHKFYCRMQERILNITTNNYYDDYCKLACHELMKPLPANVVVDKAPKTFVHGGRTYVTHNAKYKLRCASGYMYPAGTSAYATGQQSLVCNGNSHHYDDVDSGIQSAPVLGCVPITGCKDLPKEKPGTVVVKTGCKQTGGLYEYGCKISTSCADGYYPAKRDLWRNGGQDLSCKMGAKDKFIDGNGVPVEKYMECTKGCVNKTTDTFIEGVRRYTKVMTSSGIVLSTCLTTDTIKREMEHRQSNFKYYCKQDAVNTTSSYYDDYCNNACKVIQEPLPFGVVYEKKASKTFPHCDNRYTVGGGKWRLACRSGFAYPASSPYAKNGYQELTCDGKTHLYVDDLTGKQNPEIASCVKIEGCDNLESAPRGTSYKRSGCTNQGGQVNKGCTTVVTCSPGYYPGDDKYLKDKQQKLTCAADGSGWTDQYGKIVGDAMRCEKGCIVRPTKRPNTNTINMSARFIFSGTTVECSYKNVELTTPEYEGPEHDFYCKAVDSGVDSKKKVVSPCTNACKFLKLPANARDTTKSPVAFYKTLEFDDAQYVLKGYVISYECPNGSKHQLTCDGATGSYTSADGKTGIVTPPSC